MTFEEIRAMIEATRGLRDEPFIIIDYQMDFMPPDEELFVNVWSDHCMASAIETQRGPDGTFYPVIPDNPAYATIEASRTAFDTMATSMRTSGDQLFLTKSPKTA